MKLRIIQAGMQAFTGQFGVLEFVDGVSVNDVTSVEAGRMAAIVACETVEDKPRNPSPSQQVLDSQTMPFDAKMESKAAAIIKDPVKKLTREELMRLADDHGIDGLRPIGAALNVKSNSIILLIEKILKAQDPEASFIESVETKATIEQPKQLKTPEAPAEMTLPTEPTVKPIENPVQPGSFEKIEQPK